MLCILLLVQYHETNSKLKMHINKNVTQCILLLNEFTPVHTRWNTNIDTDTNINLITLINDS